MFIAQKPQAIFAAALMASTLIILSACGDDAADCGVGQSRQLEGASYCLYPERDLGDDFRCPTGMSKHEVPGGVVCAPQERAGALPEALQAPFDCDDLPIQRRCEIITKIAGAETTAPDKDFAFGAAQLTETPSAHSEREINLLMGDERYFDVLSSDLQTISYLFNQENSLAISCDGRYQLTITEFELSSPAHLELIARQDKTWLSPKSPGQSVIRAQGRLSLSRNTSGPKDPRISPLCQSLFGAELDGELDWSGELKVNVVRAGGVMFNFSAWEPSLYGDYQIPYGCAPGPQGQVQLIEGQSARLPYGLMDDYAKPLDAVNWSKLEPFTLHQPQALPRLIVENTSRLLKFKSVEGTGLAFLDTEMGQSTRIEVLGKDQVEDVEVIFINERPPKVWDESSLIPADEGNLTLINQGPITLKNGAQACSYTLPSEVALFSPDVCSIEPHEPGLKDPERVVEYELHFSRAGVCEFELSWPGTELRKRYKLIGVEPQ